MSAQTADVLLTVYSDPLGATVYADKAETRMGVSPVAIKYKVPWKRNTCSTLQKITVRWASGAEATLDSVAVCQQNGKHQQLTFVRPTGVPGREIDALFALEVQRQGAAAAAAASQVVVPLTKPVRCTSYAVGWQVFTNCY